jgi:hypothetical protein
MMVPTIRQPLADNVFLSPKSCYPDWQVQEALPLVFRKPGDAF